MTPEQDTVERMAEVIDEIVTGLSMLREAYGQLRKETQQLSERVFALEGAWSRHGIEVTRLKQKTDIHCQRLMELDGSRLHCGCGEGLDGHMRIPGIEDD